jgi:hypothetical protein
VPDAPRRDRASTAWAAAWLVVAGSAVAALAVHAVAADTHHPLPWTHLPALLLGYAAGRTTSARGLGVVLGAGAVWPALAEPLGVAAGHLPASWVAAVLGWVLAQPSRGSWHLPGFWRWPAATWALVVAATWPLVVTRELDVSLASLPTVALNHAFGLSPADTVALVAASALSVLTSLLFLDALWHASTRPAAPHLAAGAAVPLGLGLALSVAAAIYQMEVDLAWLNTAYWIELRRAPGFIGDPNVLGTAAALVGPTLAVAAWRRGARGWIAVLWLAMSVSGVLASGSRTALAAWTVGTAGLTIAAVATSRHRVRALLGVAVIAAAVGVAARSAAEAPQSGNALARAVQALSGADVFTLEGIRAALLDRYGYGPVSAAVIAAHPAWGVGIGTGDLFLADAAETLLGRPLIPDNAQNWWRQVLVELGTVGGAAPIAASLAALLALLRMARGVGAVHAVAHAAPMVGAGLILLVGVPTQHVFVQVLMAWLLVMATAPPGVALPIAAPMRRGPLVPVTVAAVCAAVGPWTVPRPPERAFAAGRPYIYGNVASSDPLPAGTLWVGQHAVGVLPARGGRFDVAVSLPHTDLATAPVGVVIGDRRGHECRFLVTTPEPVECPIVVGAGPVVMVAVDIDRGWRDAAGHERAALVVMRYVGY